MEKRSLADKMAEKTFKTGAIQKSWQYHVQAFGPILTPAFPGDYQALTHLCAALNHISNRKVREGLNKLEQVEKRCKTDADFAALMFARGLAYDMVGDVANMVQFYRKAGEYGHSFYLLDLKLAKAEHGAGEFVSAEADYRRAISLLEADDGDTVAHWDIILGSAYTNLASCLTMQYRYEEAEAMLARSKEIIAEQSGRGATEAILYAAMGRADKVEECIEALEAYMPQLVEPVRETTREILEGRHPHFTPKGDDA